MRYSFGHFYHLQYRKLYHNRRLIGLKKNKKGRATAPPRSEEHTSELQSRFDLVCRLLILALPFSAFFPYTTLFRSISVTLSFCSYLVSSPCMNTSWVKLQSCVIVSVIFITFSIVNYIITGALLVLRKIKKAGQLPRLYVLVICL